ncbi:MAG: hypothetical protein CVV64_15985 [Candidatus Wallbacteria bacterium HGW-Wallbacteria-1]|jgi:hypothetical protein|uniref:Uncharacterized protein n=1 Tax=Candidatus Wallbacteria bacterium HGW-Wallbacteria-1 TaxID=2013854 RepID=A0A2N1PL24_9BACT|nr:MAG: hypothetical protein CVV64_15985 [Candidatus Wallbacteria bacterium HGW-Wallbacteria-1]
MFSKLSSLKLFFRVCAFSVFIFFFCNFARAGVNQNFYLAEGLYANGEYVQAMQFYQAAMLDMSIPSDRSLMIKSYEKLIAICRATGNDVLLGTYEKKLSEVTGSSRPDSSAASGNFNSTPTANSGNSSWNSPSRSSGTSSRSSSGSTNANPSKPNKNGYSASSPNSDLKAHLLVYYRSFKPFEIIRFLNRDEKRTFQKDPDSLSDSLILEAKVKFATSEGYSQEKFGTDNFKMVTINKVTYRIYDSSWGRTLATNEKETDEDEIRGGPDPRDR